MKAHLANLLHSCKSGHFLRIVVMLSVLFASALSLAATGGLDAPEPVGPYLNNVFSSRAPGRSGDWTVELALPQVKLQNTHVSRPVSGNQSPGAAGKTRHRFHI